jgi:polar amino acid transport system substrate-binding protein
MRIKSALVALLFAALCLPAMAQPTLRVGATPTGTPFTFLDTKTNTIRGMMVDLVTAAGEVAGFKVDIQPMQFSTLVPALTTGKLDIVSAAMLATPARKEVIDFTLPVYTYGEGMIVPATDTKDYTDAKELGSSATVGAQLGTAYIDALKKLGTFADVKAYDTIPDLMREVGNGRLQAGFADYPIMAYAISQGQYPNIRLVKTYKPLILGSIAIAVRKDEPDLLKKLNDALDKMQDDGKLKAIFAKWGL